MSSSEKVPYPKEYRGDDPPSRKRERINENQVRQEGFQFKLTALAIAILLLLTPLASYIPELKEEEEDVSPVPIENMIWLLESELQQEAYYAAVEVLTNPVSSELTINLQEDRIRSKLIFLVETDLKTTFGDEHGLTIDVNDMNVYLSIVPVLTGSNQVVPGYYELQVDYRIETGTNGDLIGYQQKSTKIRVLAPGLFLEQSQDLIRFDSAVPSGKLQKMVSYMLTTLVRHRLKQEYGFEAYESQFNILNEGDVELAVNLAILFEELSVLKNYDPDAVEAIDKYYKSARLPEEHTTDPGWSPSNPTGQRYWGTAESENFDKYYSHVLSSGIERSITDLFESGLANGGTIDPADIFALYMILDREFTDVVIDPGDENPLLSELHLWDPRTPSDNTDVSNIAVQMNVSDPFIHELYLNNDEELVKTMESLSVSHEPKYLISGKNLDIRGLSKPGGWYTDIQLTQTRTPGTLPSFPPPAQHDYRIQWDLDITGEFGLNIGSLWNKMENSNNNGNQDTPSFFTHDVWVNKTVKLDFPITIYGWVATQPQNNAISFFPQNPIIWDAPNDTYVQLPAAQIKEYFSERLWPDMKPFVDLALERIDTEREVIRSIDASRIDIMSDGLEMSKIDDDFNSALILQVRNTRDSFWDNLNLLADHYLKNYIDNQKYWNYSESQLWLFEDGLNVSIEYSEDLKDLAFTFKHDAGETKLLFSGVSGTGPAEIVTIENDVLMDSVFSEQNLAEYNYKIQIDNADNPVEFEGVIDGLTGFEFNNDMVGWNSYYKEERFMYNLPIPDAIVSYKLPDFSDGDTVKSVTLRFGLYNGGTVEDVQAVSAELGQDLAGLVNDLPAFSNIILGKPLTTAQINAHIYGISQLIGDKFRNSDFNPFIFSANLSLKTGSGENPYFEAGIYFYDSIGNRISFDPFLWWLEQKGMEFIQNLEHLPGSMYEISRSFNIEDQSGVRIVFDKFELYFLTGSDPISVFNTNLIFSSDFTLEILDDIFSLGLFKDNMKFMIIDTMPAYSVQNTIENIDVLTVSTIPDVRKELKM